MNQYSHYNYVVLGYKSDHEWFRGWIALADVMDL